MEFFQYGETETNYLKSRDKKLGEVIDTLGHINREVHPDLFSALVNSIIGQQLSLIHILPQLLSAGSGSPVSVSLLLPER